MASFVARPLVLHLFSGSMDSPQGLAAILRAVGWDCSDVDLVNVAVPGGLGGRDAHDLASDAKWQQVLSDLVAGEYEAVVMRPPSATFRASTGPGGPRELRSASRPYGLGKADLSASEFEAVKLGNYFAMQCASLAARAQERGIGFVIAHPVPPPGCASMFHLPEVSALAALPGVYTVDFDQTRWGGHEAKPTRFLVWGLDVRGLASGEPRPRRTLLAEPGGREYPYDLNKEIAKAIVARGRARLPPGGPAPLP